MRKYVPRVLCSALVYGTVASAQLPTTSPKADPLDATAPVLVLSYRSPMASYHPWTQQSVGSWRDANETVNRIGGWRAYAKEGQEPASTAIPAATPAPATAKVQQPEPIDQSGPQKR